MPKRPTKRRTTRKGETGETSDEYERFEQTVRQFVSVPKHAIDEAREREQQVRRDRKGS